MLGLLVCGPLLLPLLLIIWLQDGKRPWFRQQRLGLNGARFGLWKLRSMVDQPFAEDTHRVDKPQDDARVTPIGRILRRWSIDELPQLLNVVRGEMSLVGPRPPLPCEVTDPSGEWLSRLPVLPGMTGLWQVSGRSDVSFQQRVKLDQDYAAAWSLGYDAWILLRTVPAVIIGKGAR